MDGRLFVYSGPSGVGKGTLLKPYLQEHENAVLSISMTTRAPRPGETHGTEYYFVSREEFEETIRQDGFLEYAEYSGNYYGTPRSMVEEQLRLGRDVFLEIEVQGAMHVKQSCPNAVLIFILPPSYDCLCRRLSGRGTEPPEVVERRLCEAHKELRRAGEYDYVIVNDDVDTARKKLDAVVDAAKCETRFMKNFVDKVCEFA